MASLDKATTFKDMPVPAYRISKTALNMLTVQYAHALADEGFTCLAVSPGVCTSTIYADRIPTVIRPANVDSGSERI